MIISTITIITIVIIITHYIPHRHYTSLSCNIFINGVLLSSSNYKRPYWILKIHDITSVMFFVIFMIINIILSKADIINNIFVGIIIILMSMSFYNSQQLCAHRCTFICVYKYTRSKRVNPERRLCKRGWRHALSPGRGSLTRERTAAASRAFTRRAMKNDIDKNKGTTVTRQQW